MNYSTESEQKTDCIYIAESLEREEVFDDLAAFEVLFIEEFGMELDAVNTPSFLLHRLN